MQVYSETIKKTRLFGLNTYEAKIWVALLSRGVSTAGELSDIANVPRSRSYDVLESLEKKGFVVMKLGKPIKYLAVPPKGVLENIKKNVEQSVESYLSDINGPGFNKLIESLQNIHNKNSAGGQDIIAVIKGRDNINKHLSYILSRAKRQIYFSAERPHQSTLEVLGKAKERGCISLNILNLGPGLCVTDEHNILIYATSEKEVHPDYDMCIWIKNRQLCGFFRGLLARHTH